LQDLSLQYFVFPSGKESLEEILRRLLLVLDVLHGYGFVLFLFCSAQRVV
jgi:hypothetical protein